MKKMLIICPHFSTGGAPAVSVNKVELLKDFYEIKVVEYSFLSWEYVVHRKKMMELVGDNFISLEDMKGYHVDDKKGILLDLIESFEPDFILMEEFPEMFMDKNLAERIYTVERKYQIFETTHDSSFNPHDKIFFPDKFVFVSAFNALRYSHLNIPQEIIEYPVDSKKQNKEQAIEKLGLEKDYKHVVIVGLFTPRKNQKYAMEIALQTKGHKVKYHFIGNQAENFREYWQPLMEWKNKNKMDNCVVWGERADVDDFMNAADLFLFTSKGDSNNKELNPIVIKEALQYPELKKLIFNLDVYLNKYNNVPNFHFLTGDVQKDAQNLISIVGAESEMDAKDDGIIILGTYPNMRSRIKLTLETIRSMKPLGKKILLVSHYPVDVDIQKEVDFYLFDASNVLCQHSYYNKFYRKTDDYNVDMNITGLKNQSLAVLNNIYNGAKFAEYLGYKTFFYNTYDVVINEADFEEIRNGFKMVSGGSNAYLGSLDTPFGKGIQTNGMFFKTKFFLETFDNVRTAQDYDEVCAKAGCENFLEDYLIKKLKGKPDVNIIHNPEETLLKKSGLGVCSNSEYFGILPQKNYEGLYVFYFYTYNKDSRKISILIREGEKEKRFNFILNDTNEILIPIRFSKENIEVEVFFIDEDDRPYKKEVFNISSRHDYKDAGFYEHLRKPKIKLVHIQTTLNDEREQRSREQLSKVQEFGIDYVLHANEPYKDLPPKQNCLRPECVSEKLYDEDTVRTLGTALTPAHYGCYSAFKRAIESEFTDVYDYLIVCEGDCIVETSIEEFCQSIFKHAAECRYEHIGYFSFGDTHTLEHGWLQSKPLEEKESYIITDHIIGIQSVMFPSFVRGWLMLNLKSHKWDAADIYFNTIFKKSPFKMGIVKNRLTTQADGYSLIDQQEKIFRK